MSVFRVILALLAAIAVGGLGVGGWSMAEHHTVTRDSANDDQLLHFSMDAVAELISTNSGDAGGYVDRVLANATGTWHDEFEARKRSVLDTMQASGGVITGRGIAAGIERRNDDGSATVLVAATSEASVPVSAGATPQPDDTRVRLEPKQYQIRVDVTEVGGKFKLSKVGFVP
ncbi:hypothetical protein OG874_16895 [Nocardia sp. NBC_00565]|uniref:hypothetical protein n=1 Tax=Nocardia sp. NBC_00565 TaxID=2975993 RepID=UPI002E818712|nr:hypothetical protein [Nocardia sp. NBC_00565]WUC06690.1 hypothetical protein OG874_16895 [Nocardia sp. NBC_00565]